MTPKKRAVKKEARIPSDFFLEAPPGIEPGIRELQSHALPLGYSAISCNKKMERITRLELATSTLARWRSTR